MCISLTELLWELNELILKKKKKKELSALNLLPSPVTFLFELLSFLDFHTMGMLIINLSFD